MGAIERYINKIAVQTAVYWGNPQNDGEGGFTYDNPVEIFCRWVDISQQISTSPINDGTIIVSRATIYTNEVLSIEGVLFLGTLEDIELYAESSGDMSIHPKLVPNTFQIKRIGQTPELRSSTSFLRVYYITPYIG